LHVGSDEVMTLALDGGSVTGADLELDDRIHLSSTPQLHVTPAVPPLCVITIRHLRHGQYCSYQAHCTHAPCIYTAHLRVRRLVYRRRTASQPASQPAVRPSDRPTCILVANMVMLQAKYTNYSTGGRQFTSAEGVLRVRPRRRPPRLTK